MDLPVEILELILLQTDTRTLLTAQRVCRLWRDVIQANRRLQEALFFRPSQPLAPGRKSVKNPLVAERVWPYFLRTHLHPQSAHTKAMAHSDRRDNRRGDAAFLRPEASWRQMLLAQPPTNSFAFVMCETRSSLSGHYLADLSEVSLRMGDLEASIGAGRLVPTPQPWALWMNEGCAPVQSETLAIAYYRHWRTRRFERARRIGDCDVVYFEICTARYLRSYRECSRLGLSFETWLKLYVTTEDEGWIL